MKLAQQRDVFLSVTLIAVVVAGVVALIGWDQYETDRDNHRQSQHKDD